MPRLRTVLMFQLRTIERPLMGAHRKSETSALLTLEGQQRVDSDVERLLTSRQVGLPSARSGRRVARSKADAQW